ncbi:hypothetical protein PLICRDRAFT_57654 [Plicaturopsis crispa FD-325 SS-3]|uniref:Uncharacterized protein n=1 Tax=Plicaturopsis crispa FD-325 SS-3 TaxID=944288 RepID=A0A0C9T7Z3_PLICR|nr:hypothetical protein PLICRDRAFT_57654 [Plicaturopsis crispa FD-325 SS-3]
MSEPSTSPIPDINAHTANPSGNAADQNAPETGAEAEPAVQGDQGSSTTERTRNKAGAKRERRTSSRLAAPKGKDKEAPRSIADAVREGRQDGIFPPPPVPTTSASQYVLGTPRNPLRNLTRGSDSENEVELTTENPASTESAEQHNKRRRLRTDADEMEDQLGNHERPLMSIAGAQVSASPAARVQEEAGPSAQLSGTQNYLVAPTPVPQGTSAPLAALQVPTPTAATTPQAAPAYPAPAHTPTHAPTHAQPNPTAQGGSPRVPPQAAAATAPSAPSHAIHAAAAPQFHFAFNAAQPSGINHQGVPQGAPIGPTAFQIGAAAGHPVAGNPAPAPVAPAQVAVQGLQALLHGAIVAGQPPAAPPIATFTPTPTNGFPPIHGWDEENVFAGMRPDYREKWTNAPGPKMFIYKWSPGYNPNPSSTLDGLNPAVAQALGHSQFTLATAVAQGQTSGARAPPYTWLVVNITQADVQTLLSRPCWSSTHATFFTLPFRPLPSMFALTITNLAYNAGDENAVQADVANTIATNDAVQQFIVQCAHPHFTAMTPVVAAQTIAASVRVSLLVLNLPRGTGTQKVWNIYVASPTTTVAQHALWKQLLTTVEYHSAFHGLGVWYSGPMTCSGCRGRDHPTGLCPYPKLPGWNGPQPTIATTPAPTPTTNHGGAPSQGFRGPRGRGARGYTRGRGRG